MTSQNIDNLQHLGCLYYLLQDSQSDIDIDEVHISFDNEDGCHSSLETRYRYGEPTKPEEDYDSSYTTKGDHLLKITRGEGHCTKGNRNCALLRAYHEYFNQPKVNCGCRDDESQSQWNSIDVENMMNLTESMVNHWH